MNTHIYFYPHALLVHDKKCVHGHAKMHDVNFVLHVEFGDVLRVMCIVYVTAVVLAKLCALLEIPSVHYDSM